MEGYYSLNLEETLKILSEKYKLFIVSNCQDGYIQCFFKAHKGAEMKSISK